MLVNEITSSSISNNTKKNTVLMSMKIMGVFIATILLTFLYHIEFQVATLVNSYDVRNHLGVRTPYRFKSNKNDSHIKYPSCRDSKIWMMTRHGTRLPKPKDIAAIENLKELRDEILFQHSNGEGLLTKKQLKQLEDWNINIDIGKEMFLTLEGQDEMILLAERMHNRFPNAIKQKYNNKTFLFRYTATQRTQQSARHFTIGLFRKKDAQKVQFAPATKIDRVLRFYKHCDRWQKQVKKNRNTYKERNLYSVSQEMNETLALISKRLGLNRVLDLDTVKTIYKFCGYETAWDKYHISPWCNAFDENTIEVLEYYNDLKTYWVDGYGYELTYRQACVPIKHMLDTFGNENDPRATFFFSHSGTILKMLTYLGLYKPENPLRGISLVKDRKWRTSEIDTFAANLAFVLYKCKDGDHILTLHQEKIVRLPMCPQDLCPIETFRSYFQESIDNCDYDNMCNLSLDRGDGNQINGQSLLNIVM